MNYNDNMSYNDYISYSNYMNYSDYRGFQFSTFNLYGWEFYSESGS